MGPGSRPGIGQPESQVLQDPADHLWVFDCGYDPHSFLTSGTDQGRTFVDLLDKPSPIAPEGLGRDHRLQHGGDDVPFLPLALSCPDRVGVGAVVADGLLSGTWQAMAASHSRGW